MSGKRYLNITLTGSGETWDAALGGNFLGITHNDKGRPISKRIEEAARQAPSEKKPSRT